MTFHPERYPANWPEIRARLTAGARHGVLAAEYGVARSTIGNIGTGKRWVGEPKTGRHHEIIAAERRGMERAAGVVDALVPAMASDMDEWAQATRAAEQAIRAALGGAK